ncbi:uncharacterized protein LOC119681320 [Teleopsis dalmanni]|uniref:uncharacterized protein LOC119681320 n=1 Tax=Teleopsis dalmanni TaxID=139649 RepID=UPI0018CF737B|nr:uncharacterized protein LOC119681320 [Teleopsis dalmanni]
MKFFSVLFTIVLTVALVAGQQFLLGQFPSTVHSQFNYNTLDAVPQGSNVRDPRQNRGPVVFPPSPPNPLDESSGVVVGASGYGFVPPQQNNGVFG